MPHSHNAFEALMPELQKALAAEGYETPTPIQEQCIPHLLDGRDLLGTAQTGTGKTAAFVLPLLQKLSRNTTRPWPGTPRALILAPTRELAAQIGASISAYGSFLRLHHTVVFGGVSQLPQEKALKRGVDILVATPGRLLDLMEQGFIHLEKVEVFVLDEVDRMLDMGFIPDIRKVLARIPERQTLFFSATMSPVMEELARTMVRDPLRVSIEPGKGAGPRRLALVPVDRDAAYSGCLELLDHLVRGVLHLGEDERLADLGVVEKRYEKGVLVSFANE